MEYLFPRVILSWRFFFEKFTKMITFSIFWFLFHLMSAFSLCGRDVILPKLTLLLTFLWWIAKVDRCTHNLKLWFRAACSDWIHTVSKFCLQRLEYTYMLLHMANFLNCATHFTVQDFDNFHCFIKNFHTIFVFRHI